MNRMDDNGGCRHICSDFDGTFFIEDEGAFRKNIDAVRRWRHSGRQFSIVTGRAVSQLTELIGRYGLAFDYFSCANGTALYDGRLRCLDYTSFAPDTVRDLLCQVTATAALECYVFSRFSDRRRNYRMALGGQSVEIPDYPCIEPQALHDIVQISLRFAGVTAAEAARLRLVSALLPIAMPLRNRSSIDIVPKGFGKPVGIEALLRKTKGTAAEILTVGDGENDVDMLKAYPSAAIIGGTKEALDAAGIHTESIAQLIDSLMT